MKIPGYESILVKALQGAANTPFEWGRHDCVTFAMDVVSRITGHDHTEGWRGTYASPRTAERAILRVTRGEGLAAEADRRFERLTTVALAQRGDLGATETPWGIALGICGGITWAFVTPDGLVWLEPEHVVAAWRV